MSTASRLCRISLVILLFLLCLAQANPASAGYGEWTGIGPYGGQVDELIVDPLTPTTLYALTMDAVYKSINGGETWAVKKSGLDGDSYATSALAMDPTRPATLYVCGEYIVYKSVDGAENWTIVGDMDGAADNLVIDPVTPTTLYATSRESGIVYKRLNGGRDWSQVDTNWTDAISSLVIDPVTPSILYVGTNDGAGVLKSTNGGQTWMQFKSGIENARRINTLLIDPSNHTTLYFAACSDSGLVFKSIDGGVNWTAIDNGGGVCLGLLLIQTPHPPYMPQSVRRSIKPSMAAEVGARLISKYI